MDNPEDKSLYEQRIAACPIHTWANVDEYLKHASVPDYLWQPFHELVLERGAYPKNIAEEQAREFGKSAVEIVKRYEITANDAQPLKMMFEQLIVQWLGSQARNN